MRYLPILTVLGTTAFSSIGLATQYNSFDLAGFTGVHIAGSDHTYHLSVDAGAKMLYGNQWYNLVSLFGFYALHQKVGQNNHWLLGSGGTNQNLWEYEYDDHDGGEVAGWDHPAGSDPNGRLLVPATGTSAILTFTFPSGLVVNEIEYWGLHAAADRTIEGRGGNTGFFRHEEAVPEPFTLMLGVAGLGIAIVRRRRAAR